MRTSALVVALLALAASAHAARTLHQARLLPAGPGAPNIRISMDRDKPNVLDVPAPAATPAGPQAPGTPGLPFGLSAGAAAAKGNLEAAAAKVQGDAVAAADRVKDGASAAAAKVQGAAATAADALRPKPPPAVDPNAAFIVLDQVAKNGEGGGAAPAPAPPGKKADSKAAAGVWLGVSLAGACLLVGIVAAAVAVGHAVVLGRKQKAGEGAAVGAAAPAGKPPVDGGVSLTATTTGA